MLRKSILGLVAMVSLIAVSAGTASAHHRCYPNHGYGYGYGYRPYPPRVVARPVPVYPYAQPYGYNFNYMQPGYVQPGLGVSTPGWGFYVR